MSIMASNLDWKHQKKEILHKVNTTAADLHTHVWTLCTCSFRSYLKSAKIHQSHVYKEVLQ